MMRCAPSRKAAAAFAFALAFAGALPFPPMPAKAGTAGAGLRLSGGSFEPYRFAHARLECEAGILGQVAAVGTDWNGGKRLLYEGQNEAWTESIDLVLYVDEGLKLIEIEADTGNGRQGLSLDLSTLALRTAAPGDAELARRAALRDLPLPFSSPRQARLPATFRLAASGLSDAASQIAASCLCLDPPTWALAALAIFIAAASGLAAVRRRMPPGASFALTLGLSVLAVAAVVVLLPREPRLIIAELPRPRDGATMPYRGDLVLDSGASDGAPVMRYSTSDPDSLSFFAVSTPGKSGIPLSVMETREGSFVFSSPPAVFAGSGGLELRFERWTTGWMTGEEE
jgi:hypothetical protein